MTVAGDEEEEVRCHRLSEGEGLNKVNITTTTGGGVAESSAFGEAEYSCEADYNDVLNFIEKTHHHQSTTNMVIPYFKKTAAVREVLSSKGWQPNQVNWDDKSEVEAFVSNGHFLNVIDSDLELYWRRVQKDLQSSPSNDDLRNSLDTYPPLMKETVKVSDLTSEIAFKTTGKAWLQSQFVKAIRNIAWEQLEARR